MIKLALKRIARLLLLMISLGGTLFGCSYFRYGVVWDHKMEVTFESDGLILAGTVYTPKGTGPFPAVVILHGSGPLQRSGFPGMAYRIHANAFVKKGFVTLIYDKRGTGESEGNFKYLDYAGFINDANSALDYLKSLPTVDPERIGIATNSESGLFAPQISTERDDVKFIYNRVGPVVSFRELAAYQHAIRLKKSGIEQKDVDEIINLMLEIFDFTIESANQGSSYYQMNRPALQAKINDAVSKFGASILPFTSQLSTNYNSKTLERVAFSYSYDPQQYLIDNQTPMYFVFGKKDQFVPTDKCVGFLEELMTHNQKLKYKIYKNDGHSLNRIPYLFFHGFYPPGYYREMTDWAYNIVDSQ